MFIITDYSTADWMCFPCKDKCLPSEGSILCGIPKEMNNQETCSYIQFARDYKRIYGYAKM